MIRNVSMVTHEPISCATTPSGTHVSVRMSARLVNMRSRRLTPRMTSGSSWTIGSHPLTRAYLNQGSSFIILLEPASNRIWMEATTQILHVWIPVRFSGFMIGKLWVGGSSSYTLTERTCIIMQFVIDFSSAFCRDVVRCDEWRDTLESQQLKARFVNASFPVRRDAWGGDGDWHVSFGTQVVLFFGHRALSVWNMLTARSGLTRSWRRKWVQMCDVCTHLSHTVTLSTPGREFEAWHKTQKPRRDSGWALGQHQQFFLIPGRGGEQQEISFPPLSVCNSSLNCLSIHPSAYESTVRSIFPHTCASMCSVILTCVRSSTFSRPRLGEQRWMKRYFCWAWVCILGVVWWIWH